MPLKTFFNSLILLMFMQACESRDNPAPTSQSQQEATVYQEEEQLGTPEKTVNPEPSSAPTLRPNGGISSSDLEQSRVSTIAEYTSSCTASDQQHSSIEKVLFYGDKKSFSRIVIHFADTSCKEEVYTDLETATFEILGSVALPEGSTQTTYRALIKDVAVSVSAPNVVVEYNQKQQCGHSDWTLYRFTDVSERSCHGKQYAASGTYKYDIAKFISGTITFGLDPAYGDSSKAPTNLSPTALSWSQGEKENPFDGQ